MERPALSLLITGGFADDDAAAVVRASVALAGEAERAGFRRAWFAEHHCNDRIAISAPLLLATAAAAETSTIRLGTGGVMIRNHDPLFVAEQAATLRCLHGDRFDLGVGSGLGFGPAVRRAITAIDPSDYEAMVERLADGLRGEGELVMPRADGSTPLWLLGSSPLTTSLATRLDAGLAYGSLWAGAPALRSLGGVDRALLVTRVVATRTEAHAAEVVDAADPGLLHGAGRPLEDRTLGPMGVVGTPERLADGIDELARWHGATEVLCVLESPDGVPAQETLAALACVGR